MKNRLSDAIQWSVLRLLVDMKMERKSVGLTSLLTLGLSLAAPGVTLAAFYEAFDFENLSVGQTFAPGTSSTQGDVAIRFMRFRTLGGTWVSNGEAEVTQGGVADGGAPQELQMNNITVRWRPISTAERAKLTFADCGGNVNFIVNGDAYNVPNFSDLPAAVGGSSVDVFSVDVGGCRVGSIQVEGAIDSWRVGGQELFIDDVALTGL